MSDLFYPLDEMTETASAIQQQFTNGQIYKTHLSNFLSEVSDLPSDIACNIIPAWLNWHLVVHDHFQYYSSLGQAINNGSLAMGEQEQSTAASFSSLE